MKPFFTRLSDSFAVRGKICVGIDPQPSMLAAWGLPQTIDSIERMSRTLVEVLGEKVAVFKPQSGFFEPYGAAGIAVLERVLADIRQAGALSILDVKRGDIGSTMGGYAQAYLAQGAPLEADSITVSPFLGFGSLKPAIELAHSNNKGIYVLARTSNPEGGQVQLAKPSENESVSQLIIDAATKTNQDSSLNAIGLVVGATHADLGCDVSGFNGSILAPGIGAQGGSMDQLEQIFGKAHSLVLPSVSRQVIQAGPESSKLIAAVDELLP